MANLPERININKEFDAGDLFYFEHGEWHAATAETVATRFGWYMGGGLVMPFGYDGEKRFKPRYTTGYPIEFDEVEDA